MGDQTSRVYKSESAKNKTIQIMKNPLTWDDYKRLVSEIQSKESEVNIPKQEGNQLKSSLQIEQSIHLATTNIKSVDNELKELESKSQEFEKSLKDAPELFKEKFTSGKDENSVEILGV